jgi:hypothetical protein
MCQYDYLILNSCPQLCSYELSEVNTPTVFLPIIGFNSGILDQLNQLTLEINRDDSWMMSSSNNGPGITPEGNNPDPVGCLLEVNETFSKAKSLD